MKTTRQYLLVLAALLAAGCGGSSSSGPEPVLPNVAAATFVTGVTNPYLPLPIGGSWIYEVQTDEGLERISILVLSSARTIQGVQATVVRDTATLDGVLIEDTFDWFAQDSQGTVWYLGEDTCEYEGGVCVSTEGSWEWGVDGALPGIIMPGTPVVDGQPYYQEYYPGHALDVGEVVALGETVTVPAGTFTDCVKTRDSSPMFSGSEFKWYCRDVGVTQVDSGDIEPLLSYSIP